MLQYTSCADPSESAARRERLRQAELQGQLEESAAQIVRASLARKDTGGSATIPGPSAAPTPTATMRIPAPKRLGPSASKSPDLTARVPIMDRLGPLLDEANSTDKDPTGSLAQKRKPGRPQGRRTTKASPIQGAGSKRRIANAKPPVCRRKITGEVGKSGTSKGRKNTKDSSSDGIPREPEGSGSDNIPICNMIPRAARRRGIFGSHPIPFLSCSKLELSGVGESPDSLEIGRNIQKI